MFFKFKEHNIFYDIKGKGKPFIILNGIMMSTKSWEVFVNSFSNNNMFIRVDFIDQGQSDKALITYDQDTQAELVKALLDYLTLDKVSVVGISYGGEVALHFAVNYPERLDRLVLFNTTAKTSAWLKDIGEGWIITSRTLDPMAYYYQTIPVIYSPHFYQKRLDWMRRREETLKPTFSNPVFLKAMERLTRSSESHDLLNRINEIVAPTLIVTAEEDYLTPTPEQKVLKDLIPNSFIVSLPKTGHASMYETPLIFASLVLGFINTKDTEYNI
ncbi:MAG: alpha/beta hydrolase [Bacillales bacterium]|jgi:pimeloyl-ACP methyl ester carboxylesterase|nr:alpha/beta hydrolase [Bacillales bacterium]